MIFLPKWIIIASNIISNLITCVYV